MHTLLVDPSLPLGGLHCRTAWVELLREEGRRRSMPSRRGVDGLATMSTGYRSAKAANRKRS
eukprot:763238-Hanusia_phi.AAC.1